MPNLVGKSLGKYHIVERLGRGGMAEVYKAYHAKLDRYVTVKILHSYLVEGQDFLARFDREARAVASLRHPHIVQIHDYEVEDDNYYMVVEFIDDGSLQLRLDELSKSGAYMPIRQVLSILGQVADALDYAHKQGIIHRDIKPSNILLDSKGNAFLSDFGIARIVGSAQFTTTGSLIGTPAYMSPEQALGQELSDTSDIYSLGVVVYELLTGKAPFAADTPLAIIHKQVNEPPLPPRVLRPDLPQQVDQVIARALAKNPAERYKAAIDLYRDLEKALPLEAAAKLDAGGAPGHVPVAAAPTIRMEEREIPTPRPVQEPAQSASEQPLAEPAKRRADSREAPLPPEKEKKESAGEAAPAAGAVPPQAASYPLPAAFPQPSASVRPKIPIPTMVLAAVGIGLVAIAAIVAINSGRKPQAIAPSSSPQTKATATDWPWAHPSVTPSSPATSQPPYTEDFESGLARGWELDSGWKVILDGSNHVLAGQGHYWARSNQIFRSDYRLSFRLRLLRGRIHLVSRYNDIGRYYIGFEADNSSMNKQIWPSKFYEDLKRVSAQHKLNTWHQIEIVSQGSAVSLYVDGNQEWTYTDPQPLSGGYFAFETQADSQAYIDDVVAEPVSGQP